MFPQFYSRCTRVRTAPIKLGNGVKFLVSLKDTLNTQTVVSVVIVN